MWRGTGGGGDNQLSDYFPPLPSSALNHQYVSMNFLITPQTPMPPPSNHHATVITILSHI